MFKHDNEPDEEHEVAENIENNELVNGLSEVKDDEIVDLDDIEEENVIANMTFQNPSQVDNLVSTTLFKCEMCDFASASKIDMNDHKESYHNLCSSCFSSFDNQEN